MGAKFTSGKWEDVEPTFAVYDTQQDRVDAFAIDPVTKRIEKREI
jgi:hypothetical protein